MFRLAALMLFLLAVPAFADGARAVSPDAKFVATAKGKVINITIVQTGKVILSIRAHAIDISALAYSPDGKLLVSADKSGKVNVTDTATGRLLLGLKGPNGASALTFSPNGKTVTVKGVKETKKFALATGKVVK